MKINARKTPKTKVLFVRGVEARNVDYLQKLSKEKGYKQLGDLINEIVKEIKRSEHE